MLGSCQEVKDHLKCRICHCKQLFFLVHLCLSVTPAPAAPTEPHQERSRASSASEDTAQSVVSDCSGLSRYHPYLQKAGQTLAVCPWDSQQRTGFKCTALSSFGCDICRQNFSRVQTQCVGYFGFHCRLPTQECHLSWGAPHPLPCCQPLCSQLLHHLRANHQKTQRP